MSWSRQEGFQYALTFVIQLPKVREVRPNIETHPAFGEALEEAMLGVIKIILLICVVKKNNLTIDESRIRAG